MFSFKSLLSLCRLLVWNHLSIFYFCCYLFIYFWMCGWDQATLLSSLVIRLSVGLVPDRCRWTRPPRSPAEKRVRRCENVTQEDVVCWKCVFHFLWILCSISQVVSLTTTEKKFCFKTAFSTASKQMDYLLKIWSKSKYISPRLRFDHCNLSSFVTLPSLY